MIISECDYNNGAYPQVLRHLLETNDQQSLTYGINEWSERAKAKIRVVCEAPNAQVLFLTREEKTMSCFLPQSSYKRMVTYRMLL